MGNRTLTALGVIGVVAGSLGMAGAMPVRAVTSTAIGFGVPIVMDPIHNVGEPTIVHSPASDNTVYASGPWGTGTQRSIWNASADLGETFRIVGQCTPASAQVSAPCGPPPNSVQGSPNPPGGGDTDQRIDHTGKDYFADLWALACDRTATTTDHGATAPQWAYGCQKAESPSTRPDGSDRQWLSVFDPSLTGVTSTAPDVSLAPLSYMEYNNLQTTQTGCSYWVKSQDGLHYSAANNDNGNFGCDGYPSVDQRTGDVFETSGCTVNNTPSLCLNIGEPDSSGNLCFLDDPSSIMINGTAHACATNGGNSIGNSLITVASGLAGDPDLLFTVSSMDTGRNLHVTYITNTGTDFTKYQAFTTVASSASSWKTWATPVQLSSSSTLNVFPWMVAGGPGRSDSVWYSTTSQTDPSVNSNQVWNVYMNQVVWPVDGSGNVTTAAPTSTQLVKVSPHPNHYNSICLAGTGCITQQGDRNLADFFTVTLDHQGAAEVEYNDTSNGLIQTGFTPTAGLADHPGAPVVTIAHQNAGPGLLNGNGVSDIPNEPGAGVVSGMNDPSGDALYPVIGGTNQPAFDLLGNNLSYDGSGHLIVTMKVTDLTPTTMLTDAGNVTGSATEQYVTRWQMGNVIYYAMAETNPGARAAGGDMFYAGPAQSIDLCSVSACDPHVTQYPEVAPNTKSENGTITCPTAPSVATPCTITITVNLADVGSPTTTSLLEEVGSYSFGAARQQSLETNANAEADQLPLEIDGICCYNFAGSNTSVVPEAPWAPGLIVAGGVLLAVGIVRNRRRLASRSGGSAGSGRV